MTCTAQPFQHVTCKLIETLKKVQVPFIADEVKQYDDGTEERRAITGTYYSSSSSLFDVQNLEIPASTN